MKYKTFGVSSCLVKNQEDENWMKKEPRFKRVRHYEVFYVGGFKHQTKSHKTNETNEPTGSLVVF